jgi:hypothetical protein
MHVDKLGKVLERELEYMQCCYLEINFYQLRQILLTATELEVPLNCFIMALLSVITATWHKYAYF